MFILGINAYHADASACILEDNQIIAAAEEERFGRIKHQAGFPIKAIDFCLKQAKVEIQNVDLIAVNSDPSSNFFSKLVYSVFNFKNPYYLAKKFLNRKIPSKYNFELKNYYNLDFKSKIVNVDHHLSHINSAYFNSGFEEAACLSIDGFGDFTSTKWGIYKENKFELGNQVKFPHSMGIFYQSLTQYLGFHNYGDEYKVMGLAPYGEPAYQSKIENMIKIKSKGKFELDMKYFRHHKEDMSFEWLDGSPRFDMLFEEEKLTDLLQLKPRNPSEDINQEHRNLAASIQRVYEKTFFYILNEIYDIYDNKNLALAGGCAMNSVANGKIYKNSKFQKVFIPPAAGDAGGSIGAAYEVLNQESKKNKKFKLINASLGPSFSNLEIKSYIENTKIIDKDEFDVKLFEKFDDIVKLVSEEIANGNVIGWFQGGMEWGPRALGNRSIISDPRREDMKEILNIKIKRRESFRPFAPSILREEVFDWFEIDDDVPFMSKVFKIKKEKRDLIPSVCHVDGTGRLQTVTSQSNKRYYKLIYKFFEITNVPILLNTSFNENEPIVCRPEEAIETFMRTKMDILVLEDWVIKRN